MAKPKVSVTVLPEGADPLDIEMEVSGDLMRIRCGGLTVSVKLNYAGAAAAARAFEEYARVLLEIEDTARHAAGNHCP